MPKDFLSKGVVFSPLWYFSDVKGSMTLLIARIPKKMIFPKVDAAEYIPAVSGLKNFLANITSRLLINAIDIIDIK